jgi:hypothetical protein
VLQIRRVAARDASAQGEFPKQLDWRERLVFMVCSSCAQANFKQQALKMKESLAKYEESFTKTLNPTVMRRQMKQSGSYDHCWKVGSDL